MIYLCILTITILSIVIHEYAHRWVAYKLGDLALQQNACLNFSFRKYIDVFGTIILPIIFFIVPATLPFGYAKSTSINSYRFKNPKKYSLIVYLSGPLANFVLACLFVCLHLFISYPWANEFFSWGILINFFMFVVNLFPISPFDGSRILKLFVPLRWSYIYPRFERIGGGIILFLFLIGFYRVFLGKCILMLTNLKILIIWGNLLCR